MRRFVFLLLLSPQDDPSIRDLIELWRERDIDLRLKATGKILSRWQDWSERDLQALAEAAKDTDEEVASRAAEALGRIRLRRKVGARLVRHVPSIHEALLSGSPDERWRVLRDAASAGRRGKLGAQDLTVLVRLSQEEHWALDAKAVVEFVMKVRSRPFVALLLPLLKDADRQVRLWAVFLLESLGAEEHAAAVLPLLKDGFMEARAQAARTLGRLRATAHVKEILPLLEDPEASVRLSALGALKDLGARESKTAVLPFLKHEDPEFRKAALEALAVLGTKEDAADVLPLLKDHHGEVVIRAIETLAALGATDRAANIIPHLASPSRGVRDAACSALVELGARDRADGIAALLMGGYSETRAAAVETLGRLRARDQASRILPLLEDRDPTVRGRAADALAMMGAREHVRAIAALLKDKDSWVRCMAARALGWLGAVEYADEVAALLKDRGHGYQPLFALASMGATSRSADIARFLRDENPNWRGQAAWSLGEMRADGHVRELTVLLEDPDSGVQVYAIRALGLIGASECAEDIAARLRDKSASVRAAAVWAIAALGARKYARHIAALMEEDNETVQWSVVAALGRLEINDDDAVTFLRNLEGTAMRHIAAAASISLVRLGRMDAAAQRRLLDLNPRDSALSDALARIHEPEAYAELHREITLTSPVATAEDLRALFKGAGFQLELEDLPILGRIDKGVRISPWDAAVTLVDLGWRIPIAEKGRVWFSDSRGAAEFWRRRLEAKK